MTAKERQKKADAFLKEFRALVHKTVGTKYEECDEELLYMIQERTSCFNPYIWDTDK